MTLNNIFFMSYMGEKRRENRSEKRATTYASKHFIRMSSEPYINKVAQLYI
jgi:hypothetical protein